jgi:hypothetical protein
MGKGENPAGSGDHNDRHGPPDRIPVLRTPVLSVRGSLWPRLLSIRTGAWDARWQRLPRTLTAFTAQ